MHKDHDQYDKINLQHPTIINEVPNFMRRFQKLQLNKNNINIYFFVWSLLKQSKQTRKTKHNLL